MTPPRAGTHSPSHIAYRGRFAPSPTGPLHFGSLLAAIASYLEARSRQGSWLVRMEDVDRPREVPGAADGILRTLERFGLCWDESAIYQSRRDDAYSQALEQLTAADEIYACACTRSEIAAAGLSAPDGAPRYPGTCRNGLPPGREARALRVRTHHRRIGFEDRVQGMVVQNLAREIGDFVLRRADGFIAYQLAVVVDDAQQGVTDIVRGSDLLVSTPRQIHLQHLLGYPTPGYMHIPVALATGGEKLSKQTGAVGVEQWDPAALWWQALTFLGQSPPSALAHASLAECLDWGLANWSAGRIPRQRGIPFDQSQT